MPQFNLRNDQTQEIDIGNSPGVSATNESPDDAEFYIDYHSDGHWHPITGKIIIKPGKTRDWTRLQLGHEHVRVGAKGLDNGTVIIRGQY